MSGSQGELKFFTAFPTKETLRLLLEWHSLYASVQAEQNRMTVISQPEAIRLLGIPARKLNQYLKEGFLKQKADGELYKYQVMNLLLKLKEEELFQSIK